MSWVERVNCTLNIIEGKKEECSSILQTQVHSQDVDILEKFFCDLEKRVLSH